MYFKTTALTLHHQYVLWYYPDSYKIDILFPTFDSFLHVDKHRSCLTVPIWCWFKLKNSDRLKTKKKEVWNNTLFTSTVGIAGSQRIEKMKWRQIESMLKIWRIWCRRMKEDWSWIIIVMTLALYILSGLLISHNTHWGQCTKFENTAV